METLTASQVSYKKVKETNTLDWSERIEDHYFLEGLWGTLRVAEIKGWTIQPFTWNKSVFDPRKGTTVSFPVKAENIEIPFHNGSSESAPWGGAKIKTDSQEFLAEFGTVGGSFGQAAFEITTQVTGAEQSILKGFIGEIREFLKTHSIYRGHALVFEGPSPKFLDLSQVDSKALILPEAIEEELQDVLFTPIKKSDQAVAMGVTMRRGILLAGLPGTGKTTAAMIAGKLATEHERTFFYAKDTDQLTLLLRYATLFAPALVYFEDVDENVPPDQRRDGNMNDILNAMDGIESKSKDIILVMTSNDPEALDPAFRRPGGRVDSLIVFPPADEEAALRLVEFYGKGYVGYRPTRIGKLLAGQTAAAIRTIIDHAKLHLLRTGQYMIDAELIELVLWRMKTHLDGLTPRKQPPTPGNAFFAALGKMVREEMRMAL